MTLIRRLLMRKKLLACLIVGITLLGFGSWKVFGQQTPPLTYQTATAERGTLVSAVSASGQIISTNIVSIATQATGTIKEVYVRDGETVKSGQKIMEINLDGAGQAQAASAYSSYLSAKNNVESAQTSLYTLQSDMLTKWDIYKEAAESSTYTNADGSPQSGSRMLPEFVTIQDNWLAAEAKYKQQQSVIAQAQSSLNSAWLSYQQSSSIVYAPIAGTVTNITFVKGMVISPSTSSSDSNGNNQRVAVIKNDSTPNATVNVSEIDVYKVAVGQRATLTLDSVTGKTFTGKVISVDRIGATTSNVTNYPVIIQFDTDDAQILPNMAVTANIITSTKADVVSVPLAAVQSDSEGATVRTLTNGKVETRTVETGLSSDTMIEIVSGLPEGATVITGTQTTATSPSSSRSIFSGSGIGGGIGGGAVMRR